MVLYGDSFLFVDLADFRKSHLNSKKPLTLSIFKNKNEGDKSNVIFNKDKFLYDKNNLVSEMEYIDYGLAYLNKKYFLAKNTEESFDSSYFYNKTTLNGNAQPYLVQKPFYEIGSPEGYQAFVKLMGANRFEIKNLAL